MCVSPLFLELLYEERTHLRIFSSADLMVFPIKKEQKVVHQSMSNARLFGYFCVSMMNVYDNIV
jgi:hypothetical protein